MEQPLLPIKISRACSMAIRQLMTDHGVTPDMFSTWATAYVAEGNMSTAERDQLTQALASYEVPPAMFYLALKIFAAKGPSF